ncbi:proteoglycan 4b, partial [Nematolebias whitei]|uniref:proteoglycan 4b n=1 Tax=Nematolebias whitei TaxID=451745 RepID=UPI0018979A99
STQSSCRGQCGAEYYRGNMCQCDYSCLTYDECCKDYESQCTTKNSCKGRCGETFKRGRLCSCDPECTTYNQCCPDYSSHCDADDDYPTPLDGTSTNPPDDPSDVQDQEMSPTLESSRSLEPSTADLLDAAPTEASLITDVPEFTTESVSSHTEATPSDDDNRFSSNSTAGEATTVSSDASDSTRPPDQGTTLPQPTEDSNQPTGTSKPTISSSTIKSTTDVPPTDEPELTTVNTRDSNRVLETSQVTTSPATTTEETTLDTNSELNYRNTTTSIPSLLADDEDPATTVSPTGTGIPTFPFPVQNETTDIVVPETTTADPLTATSEPTSKPQGKPDPTNLPPTSKPDTKPVDPQTLNTDNPRDYQGDDNDDTNLCSGRPVSGVATLRNGTMVVFRGHYFWFLDRNRVPSPPQDITQVWGVPSPIDTVFTRCNCQGKTYIFKGGKYWRFENDALDHGYPKLIKTGFDGLRGHITAALSVPQYNNRKESVYFFKRGGFVQKYSYQFGTSPTCDRAVHYPIYTIRARTVRQAVSVLAPEINIRKSWRGFPHIITAAVSITSPTDREGYKYTVFSRSISYNVIMKGERPVMAEPNTPPRTNTFFKCQKKT